MERLKRENAAEKTASLEMIDNLRAELDQKQVGVVFSQPIKGNDDFVDNPQYLFISNKMSS